MNYVERGGNGSLLQVENRAVTVQGRENDENCENKKNNKANAGSGMVCCLCQSRLAVKILEWDLLVSSANGISLFDRADADPRDSPPSA